MRRTQRAIKQVLTERYYSWRDAETIAKEDPEVNLSGNGPAYTPMEFMEEEIEPEVTAEVASEQVKQEQRTRPTA